MYKENIECGNKYRHAYREGIEKLVANLTAESVKKRSEVISGIRNNPELYREKFKAMLGWPLTFGKSEKVEEISRIFVTKRDEVFIYRLQIKILDIPFYGILFVREDNKKRPLVLVQHGGLGSPEICGNLLETGTENYNDIIERVLKYDVNVFAPQLLLWKKEFSFDEYTDNGVSYTDAMRRGIDNELKQFGSSITALEIYCINRTIDYFEKQTYVDSDKIGMIGMSYGGFYALYTTAIDKRIKCCLSSSFFNDRIKYNWTDWVWFDSGNTFTDVEVAMLVHPRSLYICISDEDEVFDINSGIEKWNELNSHLKEDKNIHFIKFEGNHEFIKDDKPIQEFIEDLYR